MLTPSYPTGIVPIVAGIVPLVEVGVCIVLIDVIVFRAHVYEPTIVAVRQTAVTGFINDRGILNDFWQPGGGYPASPHTTVAG
jgi:hypothetical protein